MNPMTEAKPPSIAGATPGDSVATPICGGSCATSDSSDCARHPDGIELAASEYVGGLYFTPPDIVELAERRRKAIEVARDRLEDAAGELERDSRTSSVSHDDDMRWSMRIAAVVKASRELKTLLDSEIVDFSRTTVPSPGMLPMYSQELGPEYAETEEHGQ